MPVLEMTKRVVAGWMEVDAAAALRWVAAAGSGPLEEALGSALEKMEGDSAPFIAMLSHATEGERRLAQWALRDHVMDAMNSGTAEDFMSKMPREDADDLLAHWACRTKNGGQMEKASRFAALMSPEKRVAEVLPDLGAAWLGSDAPGALQWLRSLPPAEKTAALSKTSGLPLNAETRAALQTVTP